MTDTTLAHTNRPQLSRWEVVAATAGAAIEFFDFSVYATFSLMIGRTFFPSSNGFISLLLSLSVFGTGFLARPVGALLIGSHADKAGRKPAMLLTMLLMAAGTALLVITPGYATLGVAAPVLLVVARILQGLAWGGEAGPATTYILEAAPKDKRGIYTSWQIVAQGAAGVAAGLIGYALSLALTDTQLQQWGWRIPFACGLVILPVAICLRSRLSDTLEQRPPDNTDKATAAPLKQVFHNHRKLVIVGILVISGSTITQYFLNYMATYAMHDLHYPTRVAMLSSLLVGAGVMLFSLLGGFMADRWGRRLTIILPRLVLTLALLPGLELIQHHHSEALYFGLLTVFTALQCISGSGLLVALCEGFPHRLRATGFSLVYGIGITLFGGTAQLLFSWLIELTGSPVAPGYYLIVTNILCMGAALFLAQPRHEKSDASRS